MQRVLSKGAVLWDKKNSPRNTLCWVLAWVGHNLNDVVMTVVIYTMFGTVERRGPIRDNPHLWMKPLSVFEGSWSTRLCPLRACYVFVPCAYSLFLFSCHRGHPLNSFVHAPPVFRLVLSSCASATCDGSWRLEAWELGWSYTCSSWMFCSASAVDREDLLNIQGVLLAIGLCRTGWTIERARFFTSLLPDSHPISPLPLPTFISKIAVRFQFSISRTTYSTPSFPPPPPPSLLISSHSHPFYPFPVYPHCSFTSQINKRNLSNINESSSILITTSVTKAFLH